MLSIFGREKGVCTKCVRSKSSVCLVVSLQTSQPPVTWQFDLEKNTNFTVVLKNENQGWNLGVTSPEGVFTPVAHFITQYEAEEAYKAVQKTLMNHGCCNVFGNGWMRFFLILAVILLAFFLIGSWGHRSEPGSDHMRSDVILTPQTSENQQQKQPVEMKDGVPLPADEVLIVPSD